MIVWTSLSVLTLLSISESLWVITWNDNENIK